MIPSVSSTSFSEWSTKVVPEIVSVETLSANSSIVCLAPFESHRAGLVFVDVVVCVTGQTVPRDVESKAVEISEMAVPIIKNSESFYTLFAVSVISVGEAVRIIGLTNCFLGMEPSVALHTLPILCLEAVGDHTHSIAVNLVRVLALGASLVVCLLTSFDVAGSISEDERGVTRGTFLSGVDAPCDLSNTSLETGEEEVFDAGLADSVRAVH